MYRLLLDLYEPEKAVEAFPLLKESLGNQMTQLRYFDQSMLLTQLINYAVRQLNKGNAGFNKEVFELYQLALEHKLVLLNSKIEAGVYQNIVSVGCKEKAFAWTEQFVEEYAPFLEADIRQDCKTMALALVSFNQSNYDRAIQLIMEHHFFNVLIQMNTRVILAKAWFEQFMQDTSHFELLMYQLDAIEKLIRRNKLISRPRKEELLNFILATKHLAMYIIDKKPAPEIRSRLEKYLDARRKIMSRDWIELKIEQYQKNP